MYRVCTQSCMAIHCGTCHPQKWLDMLTGRHVNQIVATLFERHMEHNNNNNNKTDCQWPMVVQVQCECHQRQAELNWANRIHAELWLQLNQTESNRIESHRRGVSQLLWVLSLVEQQVKIRGGCAWMKVDLLLLPLATEPCPASLSKAPPQLPLASNLLLLGNKLKFSSARFDLRSVTLAFRLTTRRAEIGLC